MRGLKYLIFPATESDCTLLHFHFDWLADFPIFLLGLLGISVGLPGRPLTLQSDHLHNHSRYSAFALTKLTSWSVLKKKWQSIWIKATQSGEWTDGKCFSPISTNSTMTCLSVMLWYRFSLYQSSTFIIVGICWIFW